MVQDSKHIKQTQFATVHMLWADTLKHLIHTVGWTGSSRMTDLTWRYAIQQAFELLEIHYIPGSYNGRLSYSHLHLLRDDHPRRTTFGPSTTFTGSRTPTMHGTLSRDALGFELPFSKFNLHPTIPVIIEQVFDNFISQNTPKYANQDLETHQELRTLARAVFDTLNLRETWDSLLVITALTLSHANPLPMYKDGLRKLEWSPLVTKRKSRTGETTFHSFGNKQDFCLNFIVTGLVKRNALFQSAPYSDRIVPRWEKRWGTPNSHMKGIMIC